MGKSSFFIEGKYGPLLRPIIKRLFAPAILDDEFHEPMSELSKQGHIVFALAKTSVMDSLLLIQKHKTDGLPVPKIVFGKRFLLLQPAWIIIGKMRNLIKKDTSLKSRELKTQLNLSNSASIMFLDNTKLKDGFDPVIELLRLQPEIEKPIFIVPLRFVYSKLPLKVAKDQKEEEASIKGFSKFWTLWWKTEEKSYIEYGDPINIQEHSRSSSDSNFVEDTAEKIKNELRHRIAQLGRNISGAPIKKKEWIIKTSLKDAKLSEYIGDITIPENQKKLETANKYLQQIASDMDPSYLKAFAKVFTWIVVNIYNGLDIDMNSLKKVKEWARKGPIVYVPCHKSHMDYMILSYILYQNWMGVPLIAAGANLSFFPLGKIFRKSGAFFLKRTFKGNELYSRTFAAYIRTLLSEKIPIEFFIEGTRSRSGKLALPKLGLLSMIVDAWKQGSIKKDITFVPVYIGYDLVVEEDAYAMEMKGGKKENENLSQLIKAGRILKRRYGKVYVRFSDPFSIRDFSRDNVAIHKSGADQDIITRELAWEILGSINDKTVVTSTSVLAAALMSRKGAIDETDAINLFKIYNDYMRSLKYDISDSLIDMDKAFIEAAALLQGRGLVSIDKSEDEPAIYEVDNESRIHMAYYKNNIINCLVPLAIVSNIILKLSGIPKKTLEDEYNRIKNLFSKEFSIKKEAFENTLNYMIEKKMLKKHWGNISFDKDKTQLISDFAGLITDYLESYLVVFAGIKKFSGSKDIFKSLESKAEIMLKKDEIQRPEALCVPNFKGAMEQLKSLDYVDKDNRIINEKEINKLADETSGYLEK
jgi:glycerol-3-phosphate O-acyltransferase